MSILKEQTLPYNKTLQLIKRLHVTVRPAQVRKHIIAELRRAKRASGAPWVRKFGKPSIQENLVMT